MLFLKSFFLIFFLIIFKPCFSEETEILLHSLKCSVIFSELETIYQDNIKNSFFKKNETLFIQVYKDEKMNISKNFNNLNFLSKQNEFRLKINKKEIKKNELISQTVKCISWASSFQLNSNKYEFIPIIPKIISKAHWEKYSIHAEKLFNK